MTFIPPNDLPEQKDPSQHGGNLPPEEGGRFPLSTSQIILGLLAVIIILGVTAMFIPSGKGSSAPVEAIILAPDEGASFPVGEIVVRIRVAVGEGRDAPEWTLMIRKVEPNSDWTLIQAAREVVLNLRPDYGIHLLDLNQPGQYQLELRAKVEDIEAFDRISFTIE